MYRIDKQAILGAILIGIGLALLCLPALHPFLAGSLPQTDDGAIHIFRAVALDHSLRVDDTLYPRFSSALAGGYGAPLFNYFPPTTYYPVVMLHALGLSWVVAWQGAIMLTVWMAALGAFLLGRIWLDERAGWITAAAYVYAPYALFDTITRGTSSEYAGMAFLPLVLWALTRLARRGNRRDWLLATGCYALFIVLHNIITLYGSLLIIAYCLLLVWQSESRWRSLTQLVSAGVLALALTAFFWWPALAETQYVKIDGVTQALDFIDVTRSLRPLSDVFALPQAADPMQLGRAVPVTLGWPALLLALPALLWAHGERHLRGLVALLVAVVMLVIFSQLEASAALWRSIPLLSYSQFATRTLSIGSLALALLAGLGGALLLRRLPARAVSPVFGALLVAIMLYAVPWLYRPTIDLNADSVADALRYERDTGQIALSSFGEYLPIWNEILPDPDLFLPSFAEGDTTPPRLLSSDNVMLVEEQWRGTSAMLSLQLDSAQTLTFNWLYVPGWRATLNGEQIAVMPQTDVGLLSITLPAGNHQVHVWLGLTDTQRNAIIVSLSTVIAIALVLIGYRHWWIATQITSTGRAFDRRSLALASAIGAAVLLGKITLIDTTNNAFHERRFPELADENAQIAAEAVFNAGIQLLDYHIENTVQSGSTAHIRLFWALSGQSLNSDFSSQVALADNNGLIVASASRFYPAGIATSNWLPGTYVEDMIALDIPATLAPADYTLSVGLFDATSGAPVDVLDEAGNPAGVMRSVSALTVLPPTMPTQITDDALVRFNGLELLSFEGVPPMAQVGDEIIVRWQWRKVSDNSRVPELAQVVWVDSTGAERGSAWVDLVTDYPAARWQVGDVWQGVQRVYVPAQVADGTAAVLVRVREADRMSALSPVLATVDVTVPERVYTLPDDITRSDHRWQNRIQLSGIDRSDDSLALYWQTDIPQQISYRLFVQAFDDDGNLLALTDGIPADWTRPTTGWDTGEIIRTTHALPLNDADYLLIGWYDPLTGDRVLIDDGGDALNLPMP